MDNLGLIRIGIVTKIDAARACVRVTFDDLDSDDTEGLLSDWLPVIQHGSTEDAGYWLPNVGAQVLCAMQSNALEVGYCVGTVYNDEDTPTKTGLGVWYKRFRDGTVIEYDPASGVKIDTPLNVTISGARVDIN
ncbi:MAG: phage baseplate assembly protein V [Armatimonadota bacterium]